VIVLENFEDTKGVIRRKDNTMQKRKRAKGQTTIYKTLQCLKWKIRIIATDEGE
jgi:hypothetical protein